MKMRKGKRVVMSFTDIAQEVTKIGGGHPSKQAIAELAATVEKDHLWFPGKVSAHAKKRGPKQRFTRKKQLQVAKTAMALKRNGGEVTVGAVQARAPKAATNPKTGQLYTAPTISKVFQEHCFDEKPTDPWRLLGPCHKAALPPWLIEARRTWAETVKAMGHSSKWFCNNCVWFDPCNTVIPAARRTVFDHGQNAKGKRKRWMSKGHKMKSMNLVATPYAAKQKQWADKRVWWFVALAKGKVVLQAMPLDFVQNGYGMAEFVNKLPSLLRKRLGSQPLPKFVMTDRGPGLFQASSGTIVAAYRDALHANGFKPFAGEEAKWQPPDVPDILLHETVVSWVRAYFRKQPFKWLPKVEDNMKLFKMRMKKCETHINNSYDVLGLCKAFPKRLDELIAAGGDRLRN